jgi:hypothetical protein
MMRRRCSGRVRMERRGKRSNEVGLDDAVRKLHGDGPWVAVTWIQYYDDRVPEHASTQ